MPSKFYITTTLPYVNSDPHLGFALEIVQADVIARYYREKGYDVFFNTGTDEHGLKIYRKAKEKNLDPQEYCDIYAEKFKALKEALNLSYNSFIRTTDQKHVKAAQEFWKRCNKNGDIYKGKYKIKYCVGCEMEKTDSELVNGKCPIHPNQELEIFEEENYFFRYSRYQKKLLDFYEKNPNFVLPKERFKEIVEFTKRGLNDFSISRVKEKMPWGISVPGDKTQVMFVWFDALVNYISCLDWPDNLKKFNDFWPGMQVAGKDNLRQQSSMWQAMLMSAGLPNSKQIFIHGFITSNGQKMSKSLGNVINPFDLVKKYGTDALRYFLLREIPPTEDGDYTYEKFEKRYNSDLAAGLGNLVARVMKLAEISNFKFSIYKKVSNSKFKTKTSKIWKNYQKALDDFKFNEALIAIWDFIGFCDKYIEKEKPWEEKNQKVINNLLLAISEIAELLKPFLPETSDKILKEIKNPERQSKPLFPKLNKKP
ncbi:MAG TPA: methionine--tRNA ligase [Candidatus Pacearchaeota archaeon]|nr:methionine--tRNA ligase [Candidatus Pacearchaeota archaeon]HOK94212.1 methionine--tRNA ligase [Candidatus Pacearchaeota archaeon]HPO75404.1 methionine--tRNA ligase [Candidatus Pacearchaeota archaeon]